MSPTCFHHTHPQKFWCPMWRIELTTYRLQGDCSTTELIGLSFGVAGENRTPEYSVCSGRPYHSATTTCLVAGVGFEPHDLWLMRPTRTAGLLYPATDSVRLALCRRTMCSATSPRLNAIEIGVLILKPLSALNSVSNFVKIEPSFATHSTFILSLYFSILIRLEIVVRTVLADVIPIAPETLPVPEWVISLQRHRGCALHGSRLRVVHDLRLPVRIEVRSRMKQTSDSTVPEIPPEASPRQLVLQTEIDVSRFVSHHRLSKWSGHSELNRDCNAPDVTGYHTPSTLLMVLDFPVPRASWRHEPVYQDLFFGADGETRTRTPLGIAF